MQRCPKCGRTYESDTQKFCTHDGGRLAPDTDVAGGQAQTTYDLNQTVRTEPYDPEATVPRMPDLNKTVASVPTSEIRSKETGPASQPPSAPTHQPPPPVIPAQGPTVMFNQPQQQYYQPPPPQPPSAQQPQVQRPHVQPPPYAPAPPAQHQYAPQAPPQARRKSSRAPLIIGLVVVLLLGGAAAWYFLIYKKGAAGANSNSNVASANTSTNTNANVSANDNANTNTSLPEPPPPPNSTKFVNSKANLDGKLAEYYSDFSFYYPNAWEKDPNAGVAGSGNFVKVERQESPEFPEERFVVSYYESKGTFEADSSSFGSLVKKYGDKFAPVYPNYRKVSEGETMVNGYKGYEFRFESSVKGSPKGDITYWGRVVFLPPGVEGNKNGITLLMLTSSLAPEIKSADDVGVRGELPVILNSFRMGSR